MRTTLTSDFFGGFIAASLVFLIGANSEGAAMGSQKAVPLITLSCPSELAQNDDLCKAMSRSLAQVAPDHIVRRIAEGDAVKSAPGDIRVTLKMTQMRDDALRGYLEWTKNGARQAGPELQYDVMDARLTPELLREFTDGLVKASPMF